MGQGKGDKVTAQVHWGGNWFTRVLVSSPASLPQKLPGPLQAFARIQHVLSTHVPLARGWHVAKADLKGQERIILTGKGALGNYDAACQPAC